MATGTTNPRPSGPGSASHSAPAPVRKRQNASQRARAAVSGLTDQSAGRRAAEQGGRPGSRRGSAKAAPKRSTAMTAAVFGTVFVVLAILVIVLVSVTGKPGKVIGFGMKPAPAGVVSAVTSVSPAAFTQAGSTITASGPYTAALIALKKQPLETSGGKPVIAYVGSNYCPYCAASRWPLTVALARFGTFKNLRITESGRATGEIYPGTPTLSYYHATYTSPYVSFLATEQCTDIVSSSSSTPVQHVPGLRAVGVAVRRWPTSSSTSTTARPSSRSVQRGRDPLRGLRQQVHRGRCLHGPVHPRRASPTCRSPRASATPLPRRRSAILVSANFYTAAICKLTNDKPGSVCNMPVVKQAANQLKL